MGEGAVVAAVAPGAGVDGRGAAAVAVADLLPPDGDGDGAQDVVQTEPVLVVCEYTGRRKKIVRTEVREIVFGEFSKYFTTQSGRARKKS